MVLPAVPVVASWDGGQRRGGAAAFAADSPPAEREESEELKRALVASRPHGAEEVHRAPLERRIAYRIWRRITQEGEVRTLRLYGFGGRSWWPGPPDTGENLARIQVLRC
ncbi:hypothetical protein [Thermomonospora catenispora]|uniref:hypothetical protein n=1 Tax=Thermomonospora catenispora TaxID=2493090 RepID=UPI0011236CC7|nr:hypothetical protein [Thermomonospora catenispora]TNY37119.1 hypothetical protein EIO00_09750 [Thermomonospora catenispora]